MVESDFKVKLGKRIRVEREKMQISLQDLANRVGFKSYQILSNIEHGKRNVSTDELIKIAKSLSLSIDYLLFKDSSVQDCNIIWRECKNPGKCREYENLLRTFCFNYKKLAEISGHKTHSFRPLSKSDRILKYDNYFKISEKLADRIISEYELGSYPAHTLIEALKLRDILVFFLDLKRNGSSASMLGEFGGAILLNIKNKPWRRNFDIAHELFHLLTWDIFDPIELNNKCNDKIESYANAFASNLLIPGRVLTEEINKINLPITSFDVINLSLKFGVSIEAMLWKLLSFQYISKDEKNKILTDSYLKKTYKVLFKEKYNTRVEHLPENYLYLLINAYLEEKISKMKMAKYLNINIGEVDYFLKKRGLPLSV